MIEISTSRWLTPPPRSLFLVLASFALQFISGACDHSKNGTAKADSHATSSAGAGPKVIIILLGLAAVVLFSFFLFKLWQKKKRDEQYARLLKLFEEDDELEVELGLRD